MSTNVYNLGSINRDQTIKVPRFPSPGETLSAQSSSSCLGGKGLNISLALHRAGQSVRHIGAVHEGDDETVSLIEGLGLTTDSLEVSPQPTGQALVFLDDERENAIVVCAGANQKISERHIDRCLSSAKANDWLVLQNETNNQEYAIEQAKKKSMKIALVAAPFDAHMVRSILQDLNLIVLNEIEAEQLEMELQTKIADVAIPLVVVTKGSKGATLYRDGLSSHIVGLSVVPVDTTAAGDTFFGYFLRGLLAELPDREVLEQANAAAALSVQAYGATESSPTLKDVEDYLRGH